MAKVAVRDIRLRLRAIGSVKAGSPNPTIDVAPNKILARLHRRLQVRNNETIPPPLPPVIFLRPSRLIPTRVKCSGPWRTPQQRPESDRSKPAGSQNVTKFLPPSAIASRELIRQEHISRVNGDNLSERSLPQFCKAHPRKAGT